jgi:hypothetical protein
MRFPEAKLLNNQLLPGVGGKRLSTFEFYDMSSYIDLS